MLKMLYKIIRLKRECKEKRIIKNNVKIDTYIESFLKSNSKVTNQKNINYNKLNDIIYNIVSHKNLVKEETHNEKTRNKN